MFIQTSTTPNVNALKFNPGQKVMQGSKSMEFASLRDAAASPLARKLLVIEGVKTVFFGPDFITVTKDNGSDWPLLRPEIFEVIMDHYSSGEPVLSDGEKDVHDDTAILPDDSEVVAMIKELLETRIRPAVAEDGGNIIFRGFLEDTGVVELELQGACSTCSSSSVTLKNGVENMLRHYVPEVKEVREVKSEETENLEQISSQAMNDLESKLRQGGYIRD